MPRQQHGGGSGNVARLNTDGILDTVFADGLAGANRALMRWRRPPAESLSPVARSPASKAFRAPEWPRLNTNGTTDTTFGSSLTITGGPMWALDVYPDYEILIGGDFTSIDGYSRGGHARLGMDGGLYIPFAFLGTPATAGVLCVA